MRLFTAITLEEDIKDSIICIMDELKHNTVRGSFTIRDNLHITLNFIGETKRLELVKEVMGRSVKKTNGKEFLLSIRDFGRFKRREGDICWLNVEKELTLWKLQKELAEELKKAGFFDIDERDYKPHLTLGRRVITGENFSERKMNEMIIPINMKVTKISLMKSERIQGKLTYTEIYQVTLDS